MCSQNTLPLNYRLCLDLTEVPGALWKSFLVDMEAKHGSRSEEYQSNFPDFKKWESLFPGMTSSDISRKFFDEDVFDFMPVVAVSYKQVLAFCEWRKEKFQQELDNMKPSERSQFPKKFLFRLPSNKEWARARFMTQENRMLKQLAKMANSNMKYVKLSKNKLLKQSAQLGHIYKTRDEKLGLYNLFDNVAEMTSDEGIAMGGSWNEANEENKWDREFPYSTSETWLGFRCIFEIVE